MDDIHPAMVPPGPKQTLSRKQKRPSNYVTDFYTIPMNVNVQHLLCFILVSVDGCLISASQQKFHHNFKYNGVI